MPGWPVQPDCGDDPHARFEETVRRAQKYIAAGADGIFVPGLEKLEEMERMVRILTRPLNIYAGYAGLPPVNELRRAGMMTANMLSAAEANGFFSWKHSE